MTRLRSLLCWPLLAALLLLARPAGAQVVTGSRVELTAGGCQLRSGTGSPEGAITAPRCSVYWRNPGSDDAEFWFKATGTGNTGWLKLSVCISTDGEILFNDNGDCRGSTGLIYNKTTHDLTITGNFSAANFSGSSGITALTGDVTATGPGSAAATIASSAVTYAKMQDVSATSKLLGRGSASTGPPQEITLGSNLSMSGTTLNASAGSGIGDFTGPSASAANEIVEFADTTGKLGQRSFAALSGPASTLKTFTLPNASATILTDNALVTVAQGGTGVGTITGLVKGNGTSAFTAASAGTDYSTPSSTDTLTNKTLDPEATGNAIGTVSVLMIPVAVCQNATGLLGSSTPATNPAVAACVSGTNTQYGVAQFADGANSLSMQGHFSLPADWVGNIDLKGKWRTSATSGSVVWQVATICVADAATGDPSFNTASTVTDTAKGTTLQFNDFSMTSITITGCTAGGELFWKFFRDPTNGSDDLAATAELISMYFVIRRTM